MTDFSGKTYKELLKLEKKYRKEYEAIEEESLKKNLSFEEFAKLAKESKESLYFIDKYKRLLMEPVIEYGKKYKGTAHSIADFKKMCEDDSLTDESGYGYYATETSKSDILVYPSDVYENILREDFPIIIWFDKEKNLNNEENVEI